MDVPEKLKDVHMHGGKSHAQMEEIRIAQVNGEINKIPANRGETIPDEFFAKEYAGYMIPDYDAQNYFVAMESRLFDPNTGKKLSRSRVQQFDPLTMKNLINTNGFHGVTTYILHDPTIKSSDKKVENGGISAENTGVGDLNPAGDGVNAGSGDGLPIDVATIANISDARKIYAELTGKNSPPNWTLESLKLKISEFLGDVK